MRQVILDTETTGLQAAEGHRVIEIGCIELINRKLTGKQYHQYLNPQRKVESGAMAVHGLTDEFLADKPLFSAIAGEFIEFISDAELIIHNAPFDVGFINHELTLTQQSWKPLTDYCQVIDTLVLARQLHMGQRNSLDALCKRYGIDNSQRDLHGALLDANLLARVYLAMTGGQGTLFEDERPTGKTLVNKKVRKDIFVQTRKLKVIKASADELAAHEDFLERILE